MRGYLVVTLYIMALSLFAHALIVMFTMPKLPEGSDMLDLYAASGPLFHSFALCLICCVLAELLLPSDQESRKSVHSSATE